MSWNDVITTSSTLLSKYLELFEKARNYIGTLEFDKLISNEFLWPNQFETNLLIVEVIVIIMLIVMIVIAWRYYQQYIQQLVMDDN